MNGDLKSEEKDQLDDEVYGYLAMRGTEVEKSNISEVIGKERAPYIYASLMRLMRAGKVEHRQDGKRFFYKSKRLAD